MCCIFGASLYIMVCPMEGLLKQIKKIFPLSVISLITATLSVLLMCAPASATGVYDIPNFNPNTWVIDQGEVINRANEGQISNTFADLARNTGNQVRIVTIRRLDYGETTQSFTQALFDKWFPTTEDKANQVLLMIDVLTNQSAIATGEEVKSLLPEETAKSVASETLLVPLRDGNKYNQAFLDSADRLSKILSGEADPGPPEVNNNVSVEGNFGKVEGEERSNAIAWIVGLLVAATVIPMATYYIYLAVQPSSNS